MKRVGKFLLIILSFSILWGMTTTISQAETSGNYTYSIQADGTVAITKYTGTEEVVEIPTTINGKTVSLIESEAFAKNTTLVTVTIPKTVKKIDSGAFVQCSNLQNINLENGIESIYSYAFEETKVETIVIPESVTYLNELAFFKCSHFTDYQVAENNTEYADVNGLLYSKDKKELLQYPHGRTQTSYKIEEGTEKVGKKAFAQNTSLKTIEFPTTLTAIEEWAFYSTNLEEVTIPENVTKIGTHVFQECQKLKKVDIQANIRLLELSLFEDATALTSVTLPETLISIRSSAFEGCTALKTIVMPASVLTIDVGTFEDTTQVDISKTQLTKLENGSYDTIEQIQIEAKKQYDKAFAMLELVNAEREKESLQPLVMNEALLENAMERAAETSIWYSHTRPDSTSMDTIIKENNYTMVGENIFKGSSNTEYALEKWMNSSGHKANILASFYTSIGIGCCEINGSTYWVQIFTNTNSEPAKQPSNQMQNYKITIKTYDYELQINSKQQTLLDGATQANYLTLKRLSDGSESTDLKISQFTCYNSHPEVATIDDYGKTTALKAGTTTIRITTKTGMEVSYNITVIHPTISFTKTEIELEKFRSTDLNDIIQIEPKGSYSITSIHYTSSNEEIAYLTFSDIYLLSQLYGIKEGSIQVTASLPNGETATCNVIVGTGLPFKDVAKEDWFYQAVRYCYDKGILKGATDTEYRPTKNITRGMIVTILWRMEGEPTVTNAKNFPDVVKRSLL